MGGLTSSSLYSNTYSISDKKKSTCSDLDELKLTMKFEKSSSKDLPTKLELELVDPTTGTVVYRKRQNIYYVKLQEKLATLDSSKDYVLTVTSIKGANETSDKVTIHNKHHDKEKEVKDDKIESPGKRFNQFAM